MEEENESHQHLEASAPARAKCLDIAEEFGADIIIADKVAHQLMEPGRKATAGWLPPLNPAELTGAIDRQRMAEPVFSDKDSIEKIRYIIHPMVWSEIEYAIAHSTKIWWQWRRRLF